MYPSLCLGLAVSLGAPAPKDKPTVVGEWAAESVVAGGKTLPGPPGGASFTFAADGKLRVRDGDKVSDDGSYTVDPKKDPAEIDLIPPAAQKKPPTQGIYKLDGDTLTLCFHPKDPKAGRPKAFESPDGSTAMVITLKRVKK